ncbi:hypothetical protein AC482_04025 [miscellaneous Crenarchaeota group-15 archaeon DG-45]|uniref:Carboxypeptidase Q n=1 Tax=miscellaneous Crenarchaeota group-15 archaeon DG-45 TaxID=1685127 RepID=A0A0M0BP64_9ARCH|nr:MAG: hypothetical protein AC482_04025 [miscellaneous Crenarchaeota group-15 archaeon DG-45]
MLSEDLLDVERDVIGDIWQNSEIHENMLYMADQLGSRFPGTESEKMAQEYMLEKLREYGYGDARTEEFTYHGWSRGPVTLDMIEPLEREFPAISLALSPGGTVEGEVVDLGSGSPGEFESVGREAVEGRIVLCSSATSPSGERVHRRTKYGYAVELGAIGFIFMNHNPGQLPPTGSLRPAYRMGGEIPGIGVSLETGTLMLRLTKDEPFRARIVDESRVVPGSVSANIVAELPGSSKRDEWIVVGGHYDGHDIAQGAMDNLSGAAVALEAARALGGYGGLFKRSIRFICFGCEEIGVTGSTCYVDQHRDEMGEVAIMINLELGGLADRDGTQHAAFTVYQPPELEEALEALGDEIRYSLTISREFSAASDHWPFYLRGVPTIYMHAEPSPLQLIVGRGWGHTSADTMDKVDPRNLQEGAMVLARLLIRLANQEGRIAEHTPQANIIRRLEETGMRRVLEIEKKWHPNNVR